MQMNQERKAAGKSKVLILNTGVWRWSRHPKYDSLANLELQYFCVVVPLTRTISVILDSTLT